MNNSPVDIQTASNAASQPLERNFKPQTSDDIQANTPLVLDMLATNSTHIEFNPTNGLAGSGQLTQRPGLKNNRFISHGGAVDGLNNTARLNLYQNGSDLSSVENNFRSLTMEVQQNQNAQSCSASQTTELDEIDGPKQNSFVTIFSIWNTMMGTSILAMPWTLQQAGFGFGIFLILFVAAIACYTAYLTVRTTEDIRIIRGNPDSGFMDIADACHYHFGKVGRIVALVFSQISLLGASIVYYVLLSNFLFNTGEYIYQSVNQQLPNHTGIDGNTSNFTDVLCPSSTHPDANLVEQNDLFHRLWIQDRTVPVWLLLILLPLISVKSPTCLGKFTVLATVSVTYLFILIGIKGYGWGVNMTAPPLPEPVANYRNYFPALTGTCSLAFYIHNALQTILRAQRNPKNNTRDVVIAFGFATATYALMGTAFFIVFPLSKLCIQDNFLDNLVTDIPVFIGRLGLLFQMSMVYPMIVYILRAQIMYAIFGDPYPSWHSVLILHIVILGFGVLFATVYPSIGTIIRFIGALCGLVYIFTIPTGITLKNKWIMGHTKPATPQIPITDPSQKLALLETQQAGLPTANPTSHQWVNESTRRWWIVRCVCYSCIILFGLANFIAQFVLLAF